MNEGLVYGPELYYHYAWCATCKQTFILVSTKDAISFKGWAEQHTHKRAQLHAGRDGEPDIRGWYLRRPNPTPGSVVIDNWFFWSFEQAQKFINNGFKEEK